MYSRYLSILFLLSKGYNFLLFFFYFQAVLSTKGPSTRTLTAAAWPALKWGTTSCLSILTSAPPLSWCSSPTPVSFVAPLTSRVTADHPRRREKPSTTEDLMNVFPPPTPSWVGLGLISFLNFSGFCPIFVCTLVWLLPASFSLRNIWESSLEAS